MTTTDSVRLDREHGTPAHRPLPLGAIKPRGWLAAQLGAQAENITGRLADIWPDVGDDSAWLGGDGEDWERGPYYLDGLLPLAHLTGDPALLERAERWVEAILASQQLSGQFGPTGNADWWPRMVALKVLISHHSATGDERVPAFLREYFRFQLGELPSRPLQSWGAARGAENIVAVWWLHDLAPEPWLLSLIDLLDEQTLDWGAYLTGELITGKARVFDHRTHGPNVAMGIKADAVRSRRRAGSALLDRSREALRALDRWHGQVHGFFSGDEWLAGREAHQGVETCQVVEAMYSLETMFAISGDPQYGDLLELLAYNLLPASSDPAMRAHQYHQQANQIAVSVGQREWSYSGDDANVFGLEPNFGCCTANLHQGWPKFVASLWVQDAGALTAVSLAPCEVDWESPAGPVRLEVGGDYPFRDRATIDIDCPSPTRFTLRIRIPDWSAAPVFALDGEPEAVPSGERSWEVTRDWPAGRSTVEVDFGARPVLVRRERQAAGVRWGSLVMVLSLGETWLPVADAPGLGEWWIQRRRSWNYGLVADGALGADAWSAVHDPIGELPFALADAPVSIPVHVAHVPAWVGNDVEAPPPPGSPILEFSALERARLVPYGSARLRIAEFPTLAWERKDLT